MRRLNKPERRAEVRKVVESYSVEISKALRRKIGKTLPAGMKRRSPASK
jgi:hypothetical protein